VHSSERLVVVRRAREHEPSKERREMKKLSMILVSIGMLAGCGASPDGAFDESVAEEGAALATGPFTLRNYQTGLCLGVKAGSTATGTPLVTWYCDGSANQRWSKGALGDDPVNVSLVNGVASDRCLTVSGTDNGTPATSGVCVGAAGRHPSSQPAPASNTGWKPLFAFTDAAGRECYRFAKKEAPAKVFGVKAGSTALGTPIILWEDYNNTHPDQIWCVY
jgi:hypothetical protein